MQVTILITSPHLLYVFAYSPIALLKALITLSYIMRNEDSKGSAPQCGLCGFVDGCLWKVALMLAILDWIIFEQRVQAASGRSSFDKGETLC